MGGKFLERMRDAWEGKGPERAMTLVGLVGFGSVAAAFGAVVDMSVHYPLPFAATCLCSFALGTFVSWGCGVHDARVERVREEIRRENEERKAAEGARREAERREKAEAVCAAKARDRALSLDHLMKRALVALESNGGSREFPYAADEVSYEFREIRDLVVVSSRGDDDCRMSLSGYGRYVMEVAGDVVHDLVYLDS